MDEKELLESDRISIHIAECNDILEELGLKVSGVKEINKPDRLYSFYKGKLYTNKTLDQLELSKTYKYRHHRKHGGESGHVKAKNLKEAIKIIMEKAFNCDLIKYINVEEVKDNG